MAYIDRMYYDDPFHGEVIPENEFNRLADIASDLIFEVCVIKPTLEQTETDDFKKAVCYQTEFLYLQGGVEAISGMSEASQAGGSERLGDYSISGGGGSKSLSVSTYNGIPVSSMMIAMLKKIGLMNRWVYAEFYKRE